MKLILYIIIVLISINLAYSDPTQIDRRQYYSFGEKLISEIYYKNIPNSDSIKLFVLFRIQYNSLSFILVKEPTYKADVLIEIECRDKEGIIRRRMEWNKILTVNSYEATQSKTDYLAGLIETNLLADSYSIKIKHLSSTATKNLIIDLPLKYYDIKDNCKTDNIPIFTQISADNKLKPPILGGKLPFTSNKNVLFFKHCTNEPQEIMTYYRIKKTSSDKSTFDWDAEVDLSGRAEFIKNTDISFNDYDGKIIAIIDTIPATNQNQSIGLLKIEIPPDKLYPGTYQLQIFKSGSSDTLTTKFEVIWDLMPLSLQRIDYAIKMTYYIMTDEEFAYVNSGSERLKTSKLLAFWSKHDPTPNTPHNEAMAEYYQRVDYAFFNFQTISEKDGAATDRGKIYILNGPPTRIERDLSQSKTKEIWHYDNLKKKFVFELLSVGNYRLIEIIEA